MLFWMVVVVLYSNDGQVCAQLKLDFPWSGKTRAKMDEDIARHAIPGRTPIISVNLDVFLHTVIVHYLAEEWRLMTALKKAYKERVAAATAAMNSYCLGE